MKYILTTLILSLFSLVGCQTTATELKPLSQIKPTVSREGSLANEILINDTINAISQILNVSSAKLLEDKKIIKFVIQQPVGTTGRMAWREMWTYNPGKADSKSFIITFREDGLGGVDFEISIM